MKLSGKYTFSAPREEVWELLMDPSALQRIIPGCERLEEIGDDTYAADIKLGLANVRGDYSGTVKLVDQRPPESYRMEGEGRGKPGFAKGVGNVELTEQPDGKTLMQYSGDAQVGGPIAGIGQRLIEGAAKSIINQSLKALSAELDARHAQKDSAPSSSSAAATSPESAEGAKEETASASSVSEHTEQTATAPSAPAQPASSLGVAPKSVMAPTPTPWPPEAANQGLTTTDVVRGIAEDFVAERPWLRWVLPLTWGFVLGILVGRRFDREQ